MNYYQFFFKEIRNEINKSLNFINLYCEKYEIKNLRDYFWFRSDNSQLYPDSLDHLFKGYISVYYLICNRIFIEYFHHLHSDIRYELENILKLENKKKVVMENQYLKNYLQKMLKNNFIS